MAQRPNPDVPPDVTAVESERQPSRDEVARRAHELYQERGRGEGQDVNDWLRAEEELRRQRERER